MQVPQAAFDPRDPLRVPPRRPQGADEDDEDRLRDPRGRPRGGDFDDDLNPLGGVGVGGSLMGPRQFPGMGGRPGGSGGRGRQVPGMGPRFDPFGPVPGMGDPDFDELLPPGMGGAPGGPRGPFGRGGLGRLGEGRRWAGTEGAIHVRRRSEGQGA